MQDIRQSKNYASYLSKTGWKIKNISNNYYYIKSLFFYTTIKLQRPEKLIINDIKKVVSKYRGLVNLIIEPKNKKQENMLKDNNFKITNPFIPSKTLVLDLKNSQKKIFDNFSKDAKQSINKNKNTKVAETKNLEEFYKRWKSSVPWGRHVLSINNLKALKLAFNKNSLFLLSENSGGIFLIANNVGYYWHGFSNTEGRKTQTQYRIVWEGIKWAKKNKCTHFDFEGIYDKRFPIKNWIGFTRFKSKFGGKKKEYPGAYQKVFAGVPYVLAVPIILIKTKKKK